MKKNKSAIDTLKIQLKQVDEVRITLTDKIEALENEKELPALKKQYEGKYFKYKNSYSGDDWWWLYSFCISVKNQHTGHFNTFQTCKYLKNEFTINEQSGFHLCQVKITKQEYDKAFLAFIKSVNKLKA